MTMMMKIIIIALWRQIDGKSTAFAQ